jgi:hypothetical protein
MASFNDRLLEREATVDVSRGLFVLRYSSGAASGSSPVAVVRPAAESLAFVEVISAPGVAAGFLSFPGECLVVRAEKAGRLLVKIMRQSADASMEASFRLEPLVADSRAAANVPPSDPSQAASVATMDVAAQLKLLAHVSRRGDVEVSAGEWAAGPQSPAAIEGLEIRGVATAGLQIELQPLLASNPPRWLDWVPQGGFAGSRGRSLALAGVRLRLTGREASRFVLSVDAVFLGSPIQSKRGREVELLAAPIGDPLVGLRLDIHPAAAAIAPLSEARSAEAAAIAQRQSGAKVRIFRTASAS